MTLPSEEYRLIPLTQGQFAKVSPEDYDWLMQWKWSARWSKLTRSFYAIRNSKYVRGEKRHNVLMHRQILGLEKGDKRHGDHVNLDTLDNRRFNLRVATKSQNDHNCPRRVTNTTGFKHVSLHKRTGKYQSGLRVDGKYMYLGLYDTPEEAFEVAKAKAKSTRGEFVRME